jgi:hypothetical protein
MKRQFTIRPVFILFVLIVFTILKLVLYDQVISRPLNDYDEARYAEIAKNMIRTGEYLIPLAGGPQEPRNLPMTKLSNGEELYPFFWKPPAIVWLQAASMYVFGINEFASRIPSLLASIGLLIVLSAWLIVNTIFKTVVGGSISGNWYEIKCVPNPSLTADPAKSNVVASGGAGGGAGASGSVSGAGSNSAITGAINSLGNFSSASAAGTNGGRSACAWAVNQVLSSREPCVSTCSVRNYR